MQSHTPKNMTDVFSDQLKRLREKKHQFLSRQLLALNRRFDWIKVRAKNDPFSFSHTTQNISGRVGQPDCGVESWIDHFFTSHLQTIVFFKLKNHRKTFFSIRFYKWQGASDVSWFIVKLIDKFLPFLCLVFLLSHAEGWAFYALLGYWFSMILFVM